MTTSQTSIQVYEVTRRDKATYMELGNRECFDGLPEIVFGPSGLDIAVDARYPYPDGVMGKVRRCVKERQRIFQIVDPSVLEHRQWEALGFTPVGFVLWTVQSSRRDLREVVNSVTARFFAVRRWIVVNGCVGEVFLHMLIR